MAQIMTILGSSSEKSSFLRGIKGSSPVLPIFIWISTQFQPLLFLWLNPRTHELFWKFLHLFLFPFSFIFLFHPLHLLLQNIPLKTSCFSWQWGWSSWFTQIFNVYFYTNDSQIHLPAPNLSPFIQPCLALSLLTPLPAISNLKWPKLESCSFLWSILPSQTRCHSPVNTLIFSVTQDYKWGGHRWWQPIFNVLAN